MKKDQKEELAEMKAKMENNLADVKSSQAEIKEMIKAEIQKDNYIVTIDKFQLLKQPR